MSWRNGRDKHFGLACGIHDRRLGRRNLEEYANMPPSETSLFDAYLKETVNLEEYPDWPEWLKQRKTVHSRPNLVNVQPVSEDTTPPNIFLS